MLPILCGALTMRAWVVCRCSMRQWKITGCLQWCLQHPSTQITKNAPEDAGRSWGSSRPDKLEANRANQSSAAETQGDIKKKWHTWTKSNMKHVCLPYVCQSFLGDTWGWCFCKLKLVANLSKVPEGGVGLAETVQTWLGGAWVCATKLGCRAGTAQIQGQGPWPLTQDMFFFLNGI